MQYIDTDKVFRKALAIVLCISIVIIPLLSIQNSRWAQFAKRQDNQATVRAAVQECVKNMEIEGYYIYYVNSTAPPDLEVMLRYELQSRKVAKIESFVQYPDGIETMRADRDYLIIWSSDEQSDTFLRENGLDEFCGMEKIAIDLRT